MQVQVSTFALKVPSDVRPKFMELMKEHDGNASVGYAFYDIDVLIMKLNEARKIIK